MVLFASRGEHKDVSLSLAAFFSTRADSQTQHLSE